MYSKQQTSNKLPDIRVGLDGGNLRLQFSTRISEKFYGKRQKYVGLGGRADTPENRVWAENIAREIQQDIDYRNGENFDITLKKYLEVRPSKVIDLPGSKPLPTLGELWEEFVQWKVDTRQVSEATLVTAYKKNYLPLIRSFINESLTEKTAQSLIDQLMSKSVNQSNIKTLLSLLSAMSVRAMRQGKLHHDYFADAAQAYSVPKKSKQLAEEEDYRAYSIEERDIIIKAFYASTKNGDRVCAELVEFLFLTGMRPSEAFALRWKHVDFDRGWIKVMTNYSSTIKKEMGKTKTGVIRIFRLKGQTRLLDLLNRLRGDKKVDDLIFTTTTGKRWNSGIIHNYWYGHTTSNKGKEYHYSGIVTQLAEQGLIGCCLKPYSTRHTFISIQANLGVNLKLLADTCGNSVDVIIKHYLQSNDDLTLLDV